MLYLYPFSAKSQKREGHLRDVPFSYFKLLTWFVPLILIVLHCFCCRKILFVGIVSQPAFYAHQAVNLFFHIVFIVFICFFIKKISYRLHVFKKHSGIL